MPNIGLHGYEPEDASILGKLLKSCLAMIGLGNDALTEIFPTTTSSCDGKHTPMPYLRIFSSKVNHIPRILAGFQKYGVHEDIEVLNPPVFFNKGEIDSGAWREKFEKKTRGDLSAEITMEKLIREAVGVVDMFDQANTNSAVECLGSHGVILKNAVGDLRELLNIGRQRTALAAEQAK